MWSIYKWFAPEVKSNDDKIILKIKETGPGRNLPFLGDILQSKNLTLKSAIIIEKLNDMSQLNAVLLTLKSLKHVEVPPRQTIFPCINPLFQELRIKAKQMNISCLPN
jgi:hypothetical protein